MSKNLHASGDLRRRVDLWWTANGMTSRIDAAYVCGDGKIRVEWSTSTDDGPYFIPFETLYGTLSTSNQTREGDQ